MSRSSLLIFLSATLLPIACRSPTAATPSVRLRAHPAVIDTGIDLGRTTLELTNHTEGSILAVSIGDGSEDGWRTPTIRWRVWNRDGKAVEPGDPPLRCGNQNGLSWSELAELTPGESMHFEGWPTYPPQDLLPGKYTAVIEYSHKPEQEWSGLVGRHEEGAMERLRNSEAFRCATEPFQLIVRQRQ